MYPIFWLAVVVVALSFYVVARDRRRKRLDAATPEALAQAAQLEEARQDNIDRLLYEELYAQEDWDTIHRLGLEKWAPSSPIRRGGWWGGVDEIDRASQQRTLAAQAQFPMQLEAIRARAQAEAAQGIMGAFAAHALFGWREQDRMQRQLSDQLRNIFGK